MGVEGLSGSCPRVLIVSRRTLRKNKFVDFVGEYHLDLIVKYGAVPIIVPRVTGIHTLLSSFEPIHGVLLCEGEDIDSSLYSSAAANDTIVLSSEELAEVRQLHTSDTAVDKEKDLIELNLTKLCLERNIPYLGICRGSQVLNVACGGTLYQDIEKELSKTLPRDQRVTHINYDNYDGHRHLVRVVKGTPLEYWFKDSLAEGQAEIMVNSYHHQGVKRLARRFKPMGFAPDGLIEGFYDPNWYNPSDGKFILGLQFHPERMRRPESDRFDYPGCAFPYKDFVKAVGAYKKRIESIASVAKPMKLELEISKCKKKVILQSLSLARDAYSMAKFNRSFPSRDSDFKQRADFLESNRVLSQQEETRLKEVGATVRNAFNYKKIKKMEGREKVARQIMARMPVEQLTELTSYYHMMGRICSDLIQT